MNLQTFTILEFFLHLKVQILTCGPSHKCKQIFHLPILPLFLLDICFLSSFCCSAGNKSIVCCFSQLNKTTFVVFFWQRCPEWEVLTPSPALKDFSTNTVRSLCRALPTGRAAVPINVRCVWNVLTASNFHADEINKDKKTVTWKQLLFWKETSESESTQRAPTTLTNTSTSLSQQIRISSTSVRHAALQLLIWL